MQSKSRVLDTPGMDTVETNVGRNSMFTKFTSVLALASIIAFANTAAAETRWDDAHRSWDRDVVQKHWKVANLGHPRHATRIKPGIGDRGVDLGLAADVVPLVDIFNHLVCISR